MTKERKPKLKWPYPAPGIFHQQGFVAIGTGGGWWRKQRRYRGDALVDLIGSIRKNKFIIRVYVSGTPQCKTPQCEYRSLRQAEAAYVGYLLTGEL